MSVFLLIMVPAVVFCSGSGLAKAEPIVIRIGYPGLGVDNRPFAYGGIAAIAHAERYIEKEFENDQHIKVEWTLFRGAGPAVNEAFASGQLDFSAGLGDLPAIVHRSNGIKTKWLAQSDVHTPIFLAVRKGVEVNRIEDLVGRKIAQFRGTNLQLAADRVLAAHGLTEKNIKFINLDFAGSVAALLSGNIDGAFGGVEVLELKRRGIIDIPYDTKDDKPEFSRAAGLYVTEEFEAKHPELVQRVVNAYVRAARWGADEANREALNDVYAKSGIPAQSFREYFSGQKLADRLNPLIDDFVIERYRDQARRALDYGLLRRPVEIESWIDRRYLERALAEQHLETYWPRSKADGTKLTEAAASAGSKAQ
ncbi:ABC transporter substrate-binding protein [Rhodomicrobium vannielii]|uniref:ABC transporter substrate-binding protein n=1 Tax=Rhodomicrobium vannielii TaxID=1069 RepID=UPI001FD8F6E1|nr:ABC transporter substrate-binding protein [Rhodomicrobium vannielii]